MKHPVERARRRARHHPGRGARPARGAALLVAMVLLSVVATLAAGMVWQQWRAVQIESAERSRAQTAWLLVGALDWARLILREDARSGKVTSLNEPWATPLAEARLSSFLAVDRDNNADADAGPEAFLAGAISDAQSRYNLRNLVAENQVAPAQLAALQRLCSSVGLGPDTADQLASGLLAASRADGANSATGSTTSTNSAGAPLAPQQMADLTWLGLDAASIERLSSVAVLLPAPTPINLNTASREVMAAVVPGLDLGSADRLVQARARRPLRTLADATEVLGPGIPLTEGVVDVRSAYFEVRGRLRLEQRVLELQSLVQRRSGLQVVAIQRQVQASLSPAGR
jgi:general secretion pathway protein K